MDLVVFGDSWTHGDELQSYDTQYRTKHNICLLYTSPSPRDVEESRMPSSA